MSDSDSVLHKIEDISYFDNLALFYLCNECPPQTLALAFLVMNEKIAGSMLGVLDVKRRKFVHELMASLEASPLEAKESAAKGLLIIADGLISRNLIVKKGQFYYGTRKE